MSRPAPVLSTADLLVRCRDPASSDAGAGDSLSDRDAQPGTLRRGYLRLLTIAFTLFSSLRVVSYLPTMWAIHRSGDSAQHSLWTWGTWLGANLTMAAWLYEHNRRRLDPSIVVTLGNALMCLLCVVLIVAYRR